MHASRLDATGRFRLGVGQTLRIARALRKIPHRHRSEYDAGVFKKRVPDRTFRRFYCRARLRTWRVTVSWPRRTLHARLGVHDGVAEGVGGGWEFIRASPSPSSAAFTEIRIAPRSLVPPRTCRNLSNTSHGDDNNNHGVLRILFETAVAITRRSWK